MPRKYLNYAILTAIVAGVAGTAVNHSRRIAADVAAMAGPDRAARIAAAKELVHAEEFMDSVSGEPQAQRVRIVRALEDWGLSDEPNATDPSDNTKKFGPKN